MSLILMFEIKTLNDMNMPKELPMRHRTPHFGHVFSGEGGGDLTQRAREQTALLLS